MKSRNESNYCRGDRGPKMKSDETRCAQTNSTGRKDKDPRLRKDGEFPVTKVLSEGIRKVLLQ